MEWLQERLEQRQKASVPLSSIAAYEQFVGIAAIDDGQQLLSPFLICVFGRHRYLSEIVAMSDRGRRTSEREFYTFFSLGARVYISSPQRSADP